MLIEWSLDISGAASPTLDLDESLEHHLRHGIERSTIERNGDL